MKTVVQKWGNSLALRIPKPFAAELQIQEDAPVEIEVKDGTLVIKPAPRARLSLDALVAGITPANRHQILDTEAPRGEEAW